MSAATRVYIERGAKRVFASAVEWPGWCRAGRDEKAALDALAACAARYTPVAEIAGLEFPADAGGDFDVVERMPGNATTDFGAPGIIAKDESRPLPAAEAERTRALVAACWAALDRVVAKAPAELRKGPRGGGRDRDRIFEHVLGAESEYAKGIGLKLRPPDFKDAAAVAAFRQALLDRLRTPAGDARWPARYAARRIAWHALDHAWEIEDRTER
ncbi:hypothetical protein EPN29_02700 [bacterium]|nr:MAG: hypothetical protein EPN29_02700 [bacterium]